MVLKIYKYEYTTLKFHEKRKEKKRKGYIKYVYIKKLHNNKVRKKKILHLIPKNNPMFDINT
jgi:hypothetical protein